jgi:pimeloyl-ACP methyl ester carboxylesterase
VRRGKGPPLLLLPGEEALEAGAPFLDELAKSHEVIIPSPPGFGLSTRPDWVTGPTTSPTWCSTSSTSSA